MGWTGRIDRAAADLFPGSFGASMTFGVLAVTAYRNGWSELADGLFLLGVSSFVGLGLLTIVRGARHGERVRADIGDQSLGFGFLTGVIAINVIGLGATVIHDLVGLGWGLWWLALVSWLAVATAVLLAVTVRADKSATAFGGNWFLLVVAPQSLVVLGSAQLPHHRHDELALVLLGLFGAGLILYAALLALQLGRLLLAPADPVSLGPATWIAAGASWVSALAGCGLLAARDVSPIVDRAAPAIESIVVGAMALGLVLVPYLVALGVWRHGVGGVPLRYHPSYWAMAFPVAMSAASLERLLVVTRVDGFESAPEIAFAIALAVAAVCVGGWVAPRARR